MAHSPSGNLSPDAVGTYTAAAAPAPAAEAEAEEAGRMLLQEATYALVNQSHILTLAKSGVEYEFRVVEKVRFRALACPYNVRAANS